MIHYETLAYSGGYSEAAGEQVAGRARPWHTQEIS